MLPNLLLRLGPFPVYSLGFFLAGSYFLGILIFWRLGKKEGFSSDDIFDLIFLTSLVALVGGRVLFLAFTGDMRDPLALIRVKEGVLWAGSFTAGLIAFTLFIRVKSWSFLRVADLAALALAFGQAVGFLGAQLSAYLPFALYLSVGYLALGGLLWLLRPRSASGVTLFVYLLLSGPLIYFAEWLRPAKALWGVVNLNFAFAVLISLTGFLGLVALILKGRCFFPFNGTVAKQLPLR